MKIEIERKSDKSILDRLKQLGYGECLQVSHRDNEAPSYLVVGDEKQIIEFDLESSGLYVYDMSNELLDEIFSYHSTHQVKIALKLS